MAQGKRTRRSTATIAASVDEIDDLATLKIMIAEFQERDGARQDELQRLATLMQQLTQANAIETILSNGFETVTGLLAPLENLSNLVPYREQLAPNVAKHFCKLLEALARP